LAAYSISLLPATSKEWCRESASLLPP